MQNKAMRIRELYENQAARDVLHTFIMLAHTIRSDEDILADYKDGGYIGELARTDWA